MPTITVPEEICVTQEDIEKAESARLAGDSLSRSCPIAQAVKRSVGPGLMVSVSQGSGIEAYNDLRRIRFALEPESEKVADSMIEMFDENGISPKRRDAEDLPEPVCLRVEAAETNTLGSRDDPYVRRPIRIRPGKKVLVG